MRHESRPVNGKSERELFTAALDCAGTAERERFLEAECAGDSGLRARVEALLEEATWVGTFMEEPAVSDTGAGAVRRSLFKGMPEAGEHLGDEIGPYKLLDFIGEGGGGSVYLAAQSGPVTRTVALKILKLGLDTKSVIARFEAERQALAMMDHPNIARVLDAGATAQGRPYFVMDYVPGAPLTDFCDANRLGIAERVAIFVKVCRAVEHAHQKGIIHRDLKPSNILVAEQDGAAVPKIIDFGVAKAIDPASAGSGVVTQIETVIGTPAYMSPEQAGCEMDIDTRSDVYSLGVLLHELLTGNTPIDGKRAARAGLEEVRRLLRESVPVRPSQRLQSAPLADRPMILHDRSATFPSLVARLRGDLDWVVMKCLERDRERRYGSASELASDLERHLAGEPVTARPPSTAYRVGKFVGRHRSAVTVGAVFLLLLVAAVAVSTGLAIRATQAGRDIRDAHRVQSELRAEAVLDREAALRSAELARLHAYVADINLSHHALADGHIAKALELLERQAGHSAEAEDLRGFEWRFLAGRCFGDPHRSLPQQGSPIEALAFSPTGDHLAIGTREEFVVWDLRADQALLTLPGGVSAVAFFPGRDRCAVASREGVWLYDLDSPDPVLELPSQGGALAISGDGKLLAASDRRGVTIWDTGNWRRVRELPWGSGPLAFSPDGRVLATGSRDGITLWPLEGEGEPLLLPDSPGGFLAMFPGGNSVAFTPDGEFVLAPQPSGAPRGGFAVGIWDARSGEEVDTIPGRAVDGGHTGVISRLSLLADGSMLATSSWDHSVGLWDVGTRTMRGVLHGHRGEVWAVAFSQDGSMVASGSKDGAVKIWPTVQAAPPDAIEGRWSPLGYSDDSSYLAALDRAGTLSIFNLKTLESTYTTELSGEVRRFGRQAVSLSRDLTVLAEALPDGFVKLRNLAEEKELVFPVAGRQVDVLSLSPDATTLITGGGDDLAWWDLAHLEEPVARIPGSQVLFSADGSTVLTVTREGHGIIWDAATRTERCRIIDEGQAFGSRTALSADGKYLAMTRGFDDFENAVSLWDTTTASGRHLGTLTGHKQTIWSLAFAPDGRTLATSSSDGTLRLWNLATRRELLAISNPGSNLAHLLFSPDGSYLVGATPAFQLPGELKVYHAPRGDLLEQARGEGAR